MMIVTKIVIAIVMMKVENKMLEANFMATHRVWKCHC